MTGISELTSYAIVDLDAITSNLEKITRRVGPDRKVYAVVKANGYGHGIAHVARAAMSAGIYGLAVGRTNEGVQLRRMGFDLPIINLSYVIPGEAEEIVEAGLITTINTLEGARALSEAAGRRGIKAAVHVKIDTGMSRYGQLPHEAVGFVSALHAIPHLDIEGIFTHFATADALDKTWAQAQFEAFQQVLADCERAGFTFRIRHAANSAAILDMPETWLDAVRPGIIVYGLYPSDEVSREMAVTPVLTLKSHLGRIRTLPAGTGVGYSRSFITPREMPVGLVPLGYGDGYHRALSNAGAVLVRGHRAPIIGRVCMDQFMVDLSDIPDPHQDDEVVLVGCQENSEISADEVARMAKTIPYEVTTSLLRRVPRVYVQGGEVVDVALLTTSEF